MGHDAPTRSCGECGDWNVYFSGQGALATNDERHSALYRCHACGTLYDVFPEERRSPSAIGEDVARQLYPGFEGRNVMDAIRGIEVALSVEYPASFHTRVNALVTLAAGTRFQRAFPVTKVLLTAEEVRAARKEVGGRLVPFMRSAAEHPDIYAFEPVEGSEPKVVVWCVHTVVHEWSDFAQFLSWVVETCDAEQRSKA